MSFVRIVFALTLLLIGATQLTDCHSDENSLGENLMQKNRHLVLDSKKTRDRSEVRLERAGKGVKKTKKPKHRATRLPPTSTVVVPLAPITATLTHSQGDLDSVYAIATLNDQLFVSRANSKLSVYSTTDFQLQRQLRIPGIGRHIYGLATCAGNNVLYVSDTDNQRVHKVDLSVTNTNNVITWTVGDSAKGLSVNRARNVLVALPLEIREYTPSGSLVRVISDNNLLWHAVELSSGLVAFSRMAPSDSVAVVSMDGRVIRSYGNEGGPGQMDDPNTIAEDEDGYVLVADQGNRRILVLNPTMTDSRAFPLPVSLQYPRALSLDQSRGRLYVGEVGGNRRVLVFENVTNFRALFD